MTRIRDKLNSQEAENRRRLRGDLRQLLADAIRPTIPDTFDALPIADALLARKDLGIVALPENTEVWFASGGWVNFGCDIDMSKPERIRELAGVLLKVANNLACEVAPRGSAELGE